MTGTTFLQIAACIAAVLIPVAIATIVAEVVDTIKPREYHAVPALRRSALLAGLLLPAAVLWAGPHGEIYAIDRIFSPDGPWNIDLRELLAERFLPYLQTVPEVYLRSYAAPLWVRIVVSAHGILVLATLLLPFRLWRASEAIRAALCDALIVVFAIVLALYFVCASYWLLHQFSFWVIAAVGLVFQRYRLQRYHYSAGRG